MLTILVVLYCLEVPHLLTKVTFQYGQTMPDTTEDNESLLFDH